jgi:heme/copper-type cytochrome/quinol oxidase subunit 4
MSHLLSPDLFQGFCVAAVAFELPVIVQLLRGEWQLPDAGSWFDEEPYYTKNTALTYVFVALLVVLVVARSMAFFLPRLRIIIAYNIVLHLIELFLFLYCFQHKQDESNVSAYAIGALMVANVIIFVSRLFYLKGHEKAVEVANLKWRQEQLAIIREKRAAYAKAKKEKKEN